MNYIHNLSIFHESNWFEKSLYSNTFKGISWEAGQSVYCLNDNFRKEVENLVTKINPNAVIKFGPQLFLKGQRHGGICINRNQILVSFCASSSPLEILRHELFHSVFNFLTDEEKSFLSDSEETLAIWFQNPESVGYLKYKELFQMVEKGSLFRRFNDFI